MILFFEQFFKYNRSATAELTPVTAATNPVFFLPAAVRR
jgi:hypothetical protein